MQSDNGEGRTRLDHWQAVLRSHRGQILKQILDWAVGRFITSSPLASMKLEKGARRERLVSIAEHRAIVAKARNPSLRALLWMHWWTGARPGELRALRWEQVRGSTAVLREHKTAKRARDGRFTFPPMHKLCYVTTRALWSGVCQLQGQSVDHAGALSKD